MRKREMSYEDYGMTKAEVRYIKEFCRNANEEEKKLIRNALSDLNPYISPFIFHSLINCKSYDDITRNNSIYVSKVDFYAYRRKGIESIKRCMILEGKWKII